MLGSPAVASSDPKIPTTGARGPQKRGRLNRQGGPPPPELRPIDRFLRLGGRPRVIAHRGFSAAAPENTLAAFELALAFGDGAGYGDSVSEAVVDMIELDVTSSLDGEVVVLHDERLDRTTDGTGSVLGTTFRELRRLDAGRWFGEAFRGERIPTLLEALELLVPRALVNIEIKKEAVDVTLSGGIVERVAERIREGNARDHVLISSFEPLALEQMRRVDPEIRTASLYERQLHRRLTPPEIMAAVGAQAFHVSQRRISTRMVEQCHATGRLIAAYTANETDEMTRLLDLGVDALFTDRPDRLIDLLQTRH